MTQSADVVRVIERPTWDVWCDHPDHKTDGKPYWVGGYTSEEAALSRAQAHLEQKHPLPPNGREGTP